MKIPSLSPVLRMGRPVCGPALSVLPRHQLLRAAQAVHRGGQNAAGIARALAAGIQPAHGGLQSSPRSIRTGDERPRLHAGEHGVRAREAPAASGRAAQSPRRMASTAKAGRHPPDLRQLDARPVGRLDRSPRRCDGAAGQKVAHALRRRAVVAAAQRKGHALASALELHARQRIRRPEVLRDHAAQQRGCWRSRRRAQRRSCRCDHAARLRRRRHDLPARTHAEGVHRPRPSGRCTLELVVRRAERRFRAAPYCAR